MARTAKAVAAVDEVKDMRFIEVELLRKYVPHLAYERDDTGKVVPVKTEEGDYLPQHKELLGETTDKFGKTQPRYREVFVNWPPGTVIPLPEAEARRALSHEIGAATMTANSFT